LQRGLDVADIGGSAVEDVAEFPLRPAVQFNSFMFSLPVVSPVSSVNELSASFAATDVSAPSLAQQKWSSVAHEIVAVCEEMRGVRRVFPRTIPVKLLTRRWRRSVRWRKRGGVRSKCANDGRECGYARSNSLQTCLSGSTCCDVH
jgi:hypothetical protein